MFTLPEIALLLCSLPAATATAAGRCGQLSTGAGFTDWQLWSDIYPATVFDISQCYTILTGTITDDGHTDIICPYNDPLGIIPIWTQHVENYETLLPITTR